MPDGVITGDEFERRQELSQGFRHGFWRRKREAVMLELRSLDVPADRQARFHDCGSTSWVLQSKADPGVYRLASNKCRDRFCDACSVEKRRTVCANVQRCLTGLDLRLLTLTLRAGDDPLDDQLRRLYCSFRKFRQYKAIHPLMAGGLFFLELTLNSKTRQWHPHLHVLFQGDYIPHEIIKHAWHQVTGDSYIVDIRRIGDSARAAAYVAKYAGKSLDSRVWHDYHRLREAMTALAGRRTFQTFGTWTDLKLSRIPEDLDDWLPIAPLWKIMDQANAGDENSVHIVRYLAVRTHVVPFDSNTEDGDTS